MKPVRVCALLCATLVACSEKGLPDADLGGDASAPSHDAALQRVSYHKHIRPLIETRCVGCHAQNGVAPFPLQTWDQVSATQAALVAAVEVGLMPPVVWNGACQPIHDDPSLSPEEKALFSSWRDDGYPEGDPADYVAPERTIKLDLSAPSLTMGMATPHTPPPKADEYRCFVLGELKEDTYVTGLQILPGAPAEVHHVQIHRVNAQQFQTIRSRDSADPKPGYACSGGTGVDSQNMFSYRPGSGPVGFEPGDAAFMDAGSHLLIQVHYNTVFLGDGNLPVPDQTKIALWTLPSGVLPERVVYRTTVFGPIDLPPGQTDVLSTVTTPMSRLSSLGSGPFGVGGKFIPGEIIGMTPHAHQLASSMSASLKRADGSSACLDDVPVWNFHWQFDYIFKQGVPYGPQDQMIGNCVYDNSLENQPVVNGVKQAPRRVSFGERSVDEMCQHYLWLRFPRDAFLAARKD
jgi:hypothetical protein